MSIGGGEILRAVMSDPANVVDYQLAFYCQTLNADNGTANASATQRGFFQCRKDRYFMMTGIIPTATNGDTGFRRISENEFIRIYDPSNNEEFVFKNLLMQASLYSESSLNWSFTLPEYILWEPASLIGIDWTGINFNGTIDFKFLTMVGIEFAMKD